MDDSADFFDCYHRFQRLEEVFRLGLDDLAARPRDAVVAALTDVRDEALKVAEIALRVGAEGDLWQVLDGAAGMWQRLTLLMESAASEGIGQTAEVRLARRMTDQLVELQHAAATVEQRLDELRSHPDDSACDAAVQVAIADLYACGDRVAVGALEGASVARLDAGVAILTATAAAAGRAERGRAQLRGRMG